jgi:hypothetical protein
MIAVQVLPLPSWDISLELIALKELSSEMVSALEMYVLSPLV